MSDNNQAGTACDLRGIREAVCVHTDKISDSCLAKDCIEDLQVYLTVPSQQALDCAVSAKARYVELLHVGVHVETVPYSTGYYTVDLTFYYRVIADASAAGGRPTTVTGLAIFSKRLVMFGGETSARSFSSRSGVSCLCKQAIQAGNVPEAIVEVVDPMLLCAHFADNCNCRCGCDRGTLGGVPAGILAAFDEPIIFDESAIRRVCISLGQFSTVRLERDTQLLIPVYDYCIPSNECTLAGGDCSCEDPCKVFDAVEFPMDDFFPPAVPSGGCCNCACPCGEK